MIIFIICFSLQIYLLAKALKHNSNLLALALAGGVILPPVILFAVTAVLDGYLEGLFEGLLYIAFSYLHLLIIGVLLIIRGTKARNSKHRILGMITIIVTILIFLFLISMFKNTSLKIGG